MTMHRAPKLDQVDQAALELFYKDLEERPIIVTTIKVIKSLMERHIISGGTSVGTFRIELRLEIDGSINEAKNDLETAKKYIFSLQGNGVITTCTTVRELWLILKNTLRELLPPSRKHQKS